MDVTKKCQLKFISTIDWHYFKNVVYCVIFANLQLFNLKLIPFYCEYIERYTERDRMRGKDTEACAYIDMQIDT